MNDAIRERLRDLIDAAERIDAALENPSRQPPGLLVARVGVAVDQATNKLAKLADALDDAQGGDGGQRRRQPA